MTANDKRDQRQSSALTVVLIIVIVFSPVAYLLSIGPAAWLHKHGYISEWPPDVYAPLVLLDAHFPPASKFFDWYIGLWDGG